jgi:hypothetical protein
MEQGEAVSNRRENDRPHRGHRLTWLHRVGYVTTIIVTLQIGVLGTVVGYEWWKRRAWKAAIVEDTRTHSEPIQEKGDRYVRKHAVQLLEKLPALSKLSGDGMRFVAMPSFGTSEYALAISRPPNTPVAQGILIVIDKSIEQTGDRVRRFQMPLRDYETLVGSLDRLTDDWPGDERDLCADGSPAAFERIRIRHVTSGIGNCSTHYAQLKLLVLREVRRFAPGPDLPTEDDWHRLER